MVKYGSCCYTVVFLCSAMRLLPATIILVRCFACTFRRFPSCAYCTGHGIPFEVPHKTVHLFCANHAGPAIRCVVFCCGLFGLLTESSVYSSRTPAKKLKSGTTSHVVNRRASDLVRLLHGALGAGAGGPSTAYLGQSRTKQSLVTIGALMEKVR